MRAALVLTVAIACASSLPPVAPHPAASDPPPPGLRLPGDVVPIRYALDLTIAPAKNVAAGAVAISATVVTPTRVVWLDATELDITQAALAGHSVRVIHGPDVIGLVADTMLPVGPLAIAISFTAKIDHQRSRGIYAETEGDASYAYTFFEPLDARRAFPCFDEPGFKVPWQLTFHVARDHVALGNAPVVREVDEPNGMKRVELSESKPLPSYLVAFVVGPFDVIDGGKTGQLATPIRFIVPKGRAAELGWAAHTTPPIVAALEDYFAMPYPYGKLDVAIVPRYWGTMEHPGIVAMGQSLALIRPEQATFERRLGYTDIVAHELAHYWFGDYVTPAWWDDTWLNEALAEWMDMNITDAVEPSWRYRDRRVELANRAMLADETTTAQAVRNPVTTREAIESSFDADITYFKGASVIRMFEAFVGRDAWRTFISHYLAAHGWGNATGDQFFAQMATDLGPPIATAFQTFVTQPGVPTISVVVKCVGHSATLALHQQQSLPAGVAPAAQRLWRVPVCVRAGDGAFSVRKCIELDGTQAELPLQACPTWVIANEGDGYYRSSVDPMIAAALLDPDSRIAKAAKPTAAELTMLVADPHAMVERDELPVDKLLAFAPLIASASDPHVASWADRAVEPRASWLDESLYQASRRWRSRAFGKTARSLGWQRANTDDDQRQQLRHVLVPFVASVDPALASEAGALADHWIATRDGIADDLVDGALAVAAEHGDPARFERYLAAARAAHTHDDRQRILTALASFRDPGLVDRALALTLDSAFDLRDSYSIITSAVGIRENRDRVGAFLTSHLDELLAGLRSDEASWLLGAVAEASCDRDDHDRLRALLVPRAANIDGAAATVARGLEHGETCIAALARELPGLRRAFSP